MELTQMTSQITYRKAADYGAKLAIELTDKLQKSGIEAIVWPKIFPITLQQIIDMPEIADKKIGKKIHEVAKGVWQELRNEAIMIESFMGIDEDNIVKIDSHWGSLFVELEQIAGNIFTTTHIDEEIAKDKVYIMFSSKQLKKYMKDFGEDYKGFVNEAREIIRRKKNIKASEKLELICMMNENSKKAEELLKKIPNSHNRKSS